MFDSEIRQIRETVQEAIDQGRLGRPQFFRCIVAAGAPPDQTLEVILSLGRSWFGSRPVQHYRLGGDGAYLTEMARWAEGQAALITISSGHLLPGTERQGIDGIDLMLVGSRGTLYHDRGQAGQ